MLYAVVRRAALRRGLIAAVRLQPENHNKQFIRCQHEAATALKLEAHKGDEFATIEERTRELLDKPKKDRPPFLKNLFLKKIDAVS